MPNSIAPKLWKSFDYALCKTAAATFRVVRFFNSFRPHATFTPKWSDKPLLKSWEKTKPTLEFPHQTDSLCPTKQGSRSFPWSHLPHNYLGKLHHASVGTPLEVEHLNLGGTPPLVLGALVLNGLVITFLAEVLLKLRISPGIFIAFTVYVVAIEEVHWRIQSGGWLSSWLNFGREHLIHHDRPAGRYNVFLPLFDWLLGTAND